VSPALTQALLLWLAAHLGVALTWPARRWPQRARGVLLTVITLGLLALPWLQPHRPFGPLILISSACLILVLKVRDFHVGAAWWREQPLGAWLRYLPMPFVLVLRRHVDEPRRPVGQNVRLLVRGVLELGLGFGLLAFARETALVSVSWWLDHFVRVLAAYALAFDGGMVTVCALLRLANVHVMEFSRHPIIARTPADFWRRYNRPGGRFLHEDVFKPLGGMRAPLRGTLLAFLVNGVLHEYMAWILVGRIQGYQLAFFALHAAAVMLTFRLRLKGGAAVVGGVLTFVFLVGTCALFFATLENIAPGWLYPRGALLP
jgi:hypothetical protein